MDQPSHFKELIKYMNEINEILESHYNTGKWTVLLKVIFIYTLYYIFYICNNNWVVLKNLRKTILISFILFLFF